VQVKKLAPLTFDYKLFVGSHVPDIMITKDQDTAGASSSLTKTSKDDILAKLKEISRSLGESMKECEVRKKNVDRLTESKKKMKNIMPSKQDLHNKVLTLYALYCY
jgi:hypothetical protein